MRSLIKKDLLLPEQYEALTIRYPNAVFTSTVTRDGINDLVSRIGLVASSQEEILELLIPYNGGTWFHSLINAALL